MAHILIATHQGFPKAVFFSQQLFAPPADVQGLQRASLGTDVDLPLLKSSDVFLG